MINSKVQSFPDFIKILDDMTDISKLEFEGDYDTD